VLLLATVALTGCRFAEHQRRAAIDAFGSFVLGSVFEMQKAAPLKQARFRCGGEAPLPVRSVPPPEDRQECLSSTELPKPQARLAAISLVPAEACLVRRVHVVDAARVRLEVRMALAELRGERVRRIVVVADPATL
jgi:hypothetical protein